MVPGAGVCMSECNACLHGLSTDAIQKYDIVQKYDIKSGTASLNSGGALGTKARNAMTVWLPVPRMLSRHRPF